MRIGVYGLAKNSADYVARWEASCRDADVRVITDTGSTDDTVARLEAAGVQVVRSSIVPWRWDVAHTHAMNNLPPDVDLCIRLDMDEALCDGWRQIVEAAAAADPMPTKIRHQYEWAPGINFELDRVHARDGYRYIGATHEGLVRWKGEDRTARISSVLITQLPREREESRRDSDAELLEIAIREMPHDARMRWYLSREYDYAGRRDDAVASYKVYLAMPGGSRTERAHACRQLSLLEPQEARNWLLRAFVESPQEPEAACRLGWDCRAKGDHAGAFYWLCFAIQCTPEWQSHASDAEAYGPLPWSWAAEAAFGIRRLADAGRIARDGLRRFPGNDSLAKLAQAYGYDCDGPER